jgi:hypothetical protein
VLCALLERAPAGRFNNQLTMPTQNTRSQIARKVNFALQLLREATELLDESSSKTTYTRLPRYQRRQERDE